MSDMEKLGNEERLIQASEGLEPEQVIHLYAIRAKNWRAAGCVDEAAQDEEAIALIRTLTADLSRLREENERYRKALQFYADGNHHIVVDKTRVLLDSGETALRALSPDSED